MSEPPPVSVRSGQPGPPWSALRRPGHVVHPSRPLERALEEIAALASAPEGTVGQVAIARASALGARAYSRAAGGPILAPGAEGMAVTALAPHGGSAPPLVAGSASHLTLTIEPGYGGARHELDGRRIAIDERHLTVRH